MPKSINLQLLEPAIANHASGARQPHAWRSARFVHTAWTDKDGAPADIEAITQTKDGYLWLGTPTGLFSFDGVRFARFEPRAGEYLPVKTIRVLLATRDGSL